MTKLMAVGAVVIALWLGGCAGKARKPEPVVVTQRVEVPVFVKPKPPKELLSCGTQSPGFQFKAGPDGGAVLRKDDFHKFQGWLWDKQGCLRALQEFVK